MRRRTKIVATIGPASGSANMIGQLLDAGVNVFRLNFSHGSADGHRQQAQIIRQVSEEKGRYVAILGDLQGPKIRVGDLTTDPMPLTEGADIILSTDPGKAGNPDIVPIHYKPLPESVGPGDTLLLDDGLIRLQVNRVDGKDVHCTILQGSTLKSRKGLNRLGGGLSAPAITEKDMADIDLAAEIGVDYLAVSFPSSADDLKPVRQKLEVLNANIEIVAKIERAEAVATDEALLDIIEAADGVMVARGDLGVEIGDAQLMGIQKKIIRLSRQANRPVITATQMMESMINSPVPTRAEVFDVANAVLDRSDAVMLSAETATGKYPVKVVKAMSEACMGAEKHPDMFRSSYRVNRIFNDIDEATAMSAIYAADHVRGIAAIICLTESGNTALMMSRLSTGLPIYAMSRHVRTCQRVALYRGVIPLHFDVTEVGGDVYETALNNLGKRGFIQVGDRVTITCGDISGQGGCTNTLKILEYKG